MIQNCIYIQIIRKVLFKNADHLQKQVILVRDILFYVTPQEHMYWKNNYRIIKNANQKNLTILQ